MNLIQQLYIGLALILIALLFAVFALIIVYSKLLKKYAQLKQQKLATEEAIKRETEARLGRANQAYAEKLKEATTRAKEIVSKAMQEKEHTETSLLEALDELDKEQQRIISGTTNKTPEDNQMTQSGTIKLQNSISKDIEEYSKTEIDNYKKAVKEETEKSQKTILENFNQEQKTLEETLESYKQTHLKQIDENIIRIIHDVSKETLGKIISTKEHEKLILQALENAKKEKQL